jgi:hypothetical protein
MTSEWKGKDLLQYIPVYNRKINFSPSKKIYFRVGKRKVAACYQCCEYGYGIYCLFDPWNPDPGFVVTSIFRISDPVSSPKMLSA